MKFRAPRAHLRYFPSMALVPPLGGWDEPSPASRHDRGHEEGGKQERTARQGRLAPPLPGYGSPSGPLPQFQLRMATMRQNNVDEEAAL